MVKDIVILETMAHCWHPLNRVSKHIPPPQTHFRLIKAHIRLNAQYLTARQRISEGGQLLHSGISNLSRITDAISDAWLIHVVMRRVGRGEEASSFQPHQAD